MADEAIHPPAHATLSPEMDAWLKRHGSPADCPHCREPLRECLCDLADASECSMCDGSGQIDGYEDDPNWYAPGEMKTCPQCGGSGQ